MQEEQHSKLLSLVPMAGYATIIQVVRVILLRPPHDDQKHLKGKKRPGTSTIQEYLGRCTSKIHLQNSLPTLLLLGCLAFVIQLYCTTICTASECQCILYAFKLGGILKGHIKYQARHRSFEAKFPQGKGHARKDGSNGQTR
jgi:hypothetical protein